MYGHHPLVPLTQHMHAHACSTCTCVIPLKQKGARCRTELFSPSLRPLLALARHLPRSPITPSRSSHPRSPQYLCSAIDVPSDDGTSSIEDDGEGEGSDNPDSDGDDSGSDEVCSAWRANLARPGPQLNGHLHHPHITLTSPCPPWRTTVTWYRMATRRQCWPMRAVPTTLVMTLPLRHRPPHSPIPLPPLL